jgi:hypothetical protein
LRLLLRIKPLGQHRLRDLYGSIKARVTRMVFVDHAAILARSPRIAIAKARMELSLGVLRYDSSNIRAAHRRFDV